jgi:ribosomal-protein-alanine N-acetyltransferase
MNPIDKNKIHLKTKRLTLRPLKIEDITDDYVAGLNDLQVNRFLVSAKTQTYQTVQEYVINNQNDSNSVLLGIFINTDHDLLIGTIRASGINAYHFCADIGICLFNKDYWEKGLATEALKSLVQFLFSNVGLHYLEAGVYSENAASITLFKNAGFSILNLIKNKYRRKITFEDVTILGIFNPSFDPSQLAKD